MTAPSPSTPEASHNRTLAEAEVARVLATIPIPPGAKVARSPHHGVLASLGCICGSVDPSLTRTRWWTVPMSYRELVHWYGAHSPANLGSAHYTDGSHSPHGALSWEIRASSTAYSAPAALVSYVRRDANRTAIRTDATLAARYDRTASTLVPQNVTQIDITRRAIDGPGPRRARTSRVTDLALLTRVTSAFDMIRGAFAHTIAGGCASPVGIQYAYAVTFRWPRHTLAVTPGAPLCGIGMGLTLDGAKLPQTLEGDRALGAVLQAAF
jgi:hypothetical protein